MASELRVAAPEFVPSCGAGAPRAAADFSPPPSPSLSGGAPGSPRSLGGREHSVSYHGRGRKTRVCRYYLSRAQNHFGSRCAFIHPCRSMLLSGECPYGARCTDDHVCRRHLFVGDALDASPGGGGGGGGGCPSPGALGSLGGGCGGGAGAAGAGALPPLPGPSLLQLPPARGPPALPPALATLRGCALGSACPHLHLRSREDREALVAMFRPWLEGGSGGGGMGGAGRGGGGGGAAAPEPLSPAAGAGGLGGAGGPPAPAAARMACPFFYKETNSGCKASVDCIFEHEGSFQLPSRPLPEAIHTAFALRAWEKRRAAEARAAAAAAAAAGAAAAEGDACAGGGASGRALSAAASLPSTASCASTLSGLAASPVGTPALAGRHAGSLPPVLFLGGSRGAGSRRGGSSVSLSSAAAGADGAGAGAGRFGGGGAGKPAAATTASAAAAAPASAAAAAAAAAASGEDDDLAELARLVDVGLPLGELGGAWGGVDGVDVQ